jgi:hypothetical protein
VARVGSLHVGRRAHPSAQGLTWVCSDFQADGTHPSGAGREQEHAALARLRSRRHDRALVVPRAALIQSSTPRQDDLDRHAAVDGLGRTPSATTNDFRITLQGALPKRDRGGLSRSGAGGIPFLVARSWSKPPLVPLAPVTTSPGGSAQCRSRHSRPDRPLRPLRVLVPRPRPPRRHGRGALQRPPGALPALTSRGLTPSED